MLTPLKPPFLCMLLATPRQAERNIITGNGVAVFNIAETLQPFCVQNLVTKAVFTADVTPSNR